MNRKSLSGLVTYLYLMRFSLLLWLSPVLLLILDWKVTSIYTRSLFLPEDWASYLCNTFFASASGVVALVTARIVGLNGEDRFSVPLPGFLKRFVEGETTGAALQSLALCQLPTIVAFIWIAVLAHEQDIYLTAVLRGALCGFAVSASFWVAINALYLWIYKPEAYPEDQSGAPRPPHALLFPASWIGFAEIRTMNLSQTGRLQTPFSWPLQKLARLGPGYAPASNDPINIVWEGHAFALFALAALFVLYLCLFPLTAPLRLPSCAYTALALLLAVNFIFIAILWSAGTAIPCKAQNHRLWITALLLLVWVVIACLYNYWDAQRFPAFSSLMVLIMWVLWGATGVAFLLDRYRAPVATSAFLALFLVGLIPWPTDERYFVTTSNNVSTPLPAPDEILRTLESRQDSDPMIVITATGGGLHAAAWTAEILGKLETSAWKEFGDSYKLHEHVLLLSTVSGGSVGAYSYLRELAMSEPFSNPNAAVERMQAASSCSSLEGVAWGLAYVDFMNGVTHLPLDRSGTSTLGPGLLRDRSWALSAGIQRNLTDPACYASKAEAAKADGMNSHGIGLTLHTVSVGQFPAFTMNTTAVESGERFRLSNYSIPDEKQALKPPFVPSTSFLEVYGPLIDSKGVDKTQHPDLPLAVAAQLSATFPYVSSVARLPERFAEPLLLRKRLSAFHFADGGYYDNDGVASAIEFLWFALSKRQANVNPTGQSKPPNTSASGQMRLPHIIFIEIRDGGDIPSHDKDTLDQQGANANAMHPISQFGAPLSTFWNASHESISMRNQRELAMLRDALRLGDNLYPVVIPFGSGDHGISWSLTPRQRCEIKAAAKSERVTAAISEILAEILKVRPDLAPNNLAQKPGKP